MYFNHYEPKFVIVVVAAAVVVIAFVFLLLFFLGFGPKLHWDAINVGTLLMLADNLG